jgi:putative intracellular protease/amidase
MVLCLAGILTGKRATVWEPGMPDNLTTFEAKGVHYTGEPVTVDGSIVTANSPDAAEAFAQALLEQLQLQTASA